MIAFLENLEMGGWKDYGLCSDEDGELWFSGVNSKLARAKAICKECPVRELCLEEGLTEEFGVWGGYDELERQALYGLRLRCVACSHPGLNLKPRRKKSIQGTTPTYLCPACGKQQKQ